MCVYCRLNEKKDSKYIIRKDGKYAMTEDGKKVPKICPECGAEMTLQIKGEPIYICKNDHYFGTMKFSLKEGFEFDSVNKNKKHLNAVDIMFWDKLNAIAEKIINYDKNTILSYDEKEFMLSLAPGTYLTTDEEINPLVRNYIKIFGYDCDLNWIDTSNVTDMSYLFDEIRSFTGNVSEWDVSNVTNMGNMFGSTNFNGDISKWDVSNVTDMDSMFEFSLFNGDISNWDVSNVTDMSYMFMESQFNGDISKWDVSNVEVMTCMFYKSQFNGDISKWDVSNVINMKRMFYKSPFSGNLDNWDVRKVSNLVKIFQKTPLESNPPLWYTKKVKEQNGVLVKESFDFDSVNKQKKSINAYDAILAKIVQKILYKSRLSKEDRNVILSLPVASYKTNDSEIHLLIEKCIEFFGPTCNLNWIDTSNVTNMKKLFWETEFNGDISQWNVSNVTDMTAMFCSQKDSFYAFNGDLNNWDVSNVTTMEMMFMGACGANPSISKWDVSNVKDMYQMFAYNQKFDDDISNWNVGNVRNMALMFYSSGFNGDLSKWDVSKVQDMHGMFSSSYFKGNNGSLSNWDVSNVTNMRSMFNQTNFNDDISNWDVSSVTNMAYMFAYSIFNNDISNWNICPGADTNCMFNRCDIINEYKPKKLIKESFDFGTINNKKQHINIYDKVFRIIEKIIKKGRITNISNAEYDLLIQYTGIYKPANKQQLKSIISKFITYFGNNCNLNWIDVSGITNMDYLFNESFFDGDISQWDVSNVITMRQMFGDSMFTSDISNWNVSNVTNMQTMFACSKFNGDISQWDVSNVTDMSHMFDNSKFNSDISQWDVSNVTDMSHMFEGPHFNGDISQWDVSNVTDMEAMFYANSVFNQDISNWDVSNVTDMNFMFASTNFNGDISKWDVSNVIDMHCMFYANSVFNQDISNWDVKKVKEIGDIFTNSMIQNEYKPKFNITEAFDFGSINDTRSKDALKTIERLQHEQDFIDVPKIKGPELTKLKGFVAGMQKSDPEIHYTYTQDKDNVNGRILKIFTNNHVLHMFVKKYLALKEFLESKGIELKIVPVCDQGKLNIWYTGQTELGIAPNEYQFDLDTNASVLKGWKINNIILDGFVISFWSTYDNEGGRSGQQLYQLAHNSQHVYLYNCSYSPNEKEMNKRVVNVLHHKLKHLKHSTLHLKAAISSINNGKDVDILALKWLREAFDFNALKDTSKTGIQRTVDAYIETAFKTDFIAAKTTAVRKAIEGYIKSIRRYDYENNLHFEYTEEDNILKIKMLKPDQEICFNTSPIIRLSSKMFNLGKSLPKIEFILRKQGAKILNIHLNTGLSMEDIATKGHSLTYYIEHGLYMLDLKHIALDNLILDRFVLNDEDISYLYDLNVKHIFTPKSRFTSVTKMINYKEFMNFPHISFTNNQGKTPKGLFMDEIEQVSNYE